jgi:hypothetical protein
VTAKRGVINVITVTCFLKLDGAWRILVIRRNQGEIMYSAINIYGNGYNFMCLYSVNLVYQQREQVIIRTAAIPTPG